MAYTMQAAKQFGTLSVQALALQMQDEAYTFAYYLLGDERAAEAATQAAFTGLLRKGAMRAEQFRQDLLRGILAGSRKYAIPVTSAANAPREDLTRALMNLPAEQRSALVLVDVLGLNYDDAAGVLGCSRKQFAHLLAQGRMNFTPGKLVQ